MVADRPRVLSQSREDEHPPSDRLTGSTGMQLLLTMPGSAVHRRTYPATARTDQVGRVNQEMRELTTEQAAGLLGVSSDVLQKWEHRFGYPGATSSADGERIYVYRQLVALRDALMRELSVTSAIRTAQHVLDQNRDVGTTGPASGGLNSAGSSEQPPR
jgi:hypothetical protein